MTVAGGLELAAWILSAVITGWLVLDMVRVGRAHDEESLINSMAADDDPTEPASTRDPGRDGS
jgi:hypothetical protein